MAVKVGKKERREGERKVKGEEEEDGHAENEEQEDVYT